MAVPQGTRVGSLRGVVGFALILAGALVSHPPGVAAQDCDGDGVPDSLEFSGVLVSEDFAGGVPAGWTVSGLWHTTTSCVGTSPCGSGGAAAYFGLDGACNYSTGTDVSGDLSTMSVAIPAESAFFTLSFCSRYDGEGEAAPTGYDSAWVEVNGFILDDVGSTAAAGWERRVVDLTPFAGTTIQVRFRFDSIDNFANSTFGWAIDDVVIGRVDDCNGNFIADACEFTTSLLSEDFSAGLPGWTASGFWNITSTCFTGPGCDATPFAYFGETSTCTFDVGVATGTLLSPLIPLPATALGARLEYCSAYQGEGLGSGYDLARVRVNGIVVDAPSTDGTVSWETRTIDLSAFLGQSIQLDFTFDSVDGISNAWLGWQIDGIRIETIPDCDGNGVLDECDLDSGTATDCNGNGIPDSCDFASGASSDCDLDGTLDDCERTIGLADIGFDSGTLPSGSTISGLWNVTSSCASPGCGGGPRAYFGDPLACNFSTGAAVTGVLELFRIAVPGRAVGAALEYCSTYDGESGSALSGVGYDLAWVEVDGVLVDDVSIDGTTSGSELRRVSLAAYRGRDIVISFHFDSVDQFANGSLGWQVDDIRVSIAPDCDGNGVLDACDPDCNGNGIADPCEERVVASSDFDIGYFGDWTPSGLWTLDDDCGPAGGCDGGSGAYYGDTTGCNFDVGDTSGVLLGSAISIPAVAGPVSLRYCSLYDGEGGIPGTALGYDLAWVEVNGTIVDSVSNTAPLGVWQDRSVDLTPYAGTSVTIAYHFDSVDASFNDTLGWKIDGVRIEFPPDCNANGIDDICDIGSGTSADCDGNGVLDSCDIAGGASDCDLDGVLDTCQQPFSLTQDFSSGSLPPTWTATGSWGVSEMCSEPGSCSDGPVAYFGDPDQCTYDHGTDQFGDLTLPAIPLPAPAGAVMLRYCSRYQGEAGSAGGAGYDWAWVEVNGVVVDDVSGSNLEGVDTGWESRSVDLTAYAGQTVTIAFRFDTIDSCCSTGYLGWQIDNLELIAAPDCNANGVPDVCDIGGGTSTDSDSNGVPDECEPDLLVRGNCNGLDAAVNIADAVYLLGYLFPGTGAPNPLGCRDACDANDDAALNIADAVTLLNSLFGPGIPLPPPNPSTGCGIDPTTQLGCNTSPPPC
jgi:hypothetical protein